MRIDSLQIGSIETHQQDGEPWVTATYKKVVAGAVRLNEGGLEGDQQADRKHHGGPDKAVLVYSHDHYSAWEHDLFHQPLPAGAFGENILVSGMSEQDCCVGDVFRVGEAVVQVSQPRQPCWKQARRWGIKDLTLQMIQTGRCGWYLRVKKPGLIAAGDRFELMERPHAEWTLPRAHQIMHFGKNDREGTLALIAVAALSEAWKDELRRRL